MPHDRAVDILNRQVCHLGRDLEIGVPRDHLVLEGRGFGHRPRAHVEADRTALHIDDRMMTIRPSHSGPRKLRESVECIYRFGAYDLLPNSATPRTYPDIHAIINIDLTCVANGHRKFVLV